MKHRPEIVETRPLPAITPPEPPEPPEWGGWFTPVIDPCARITAGCPAWHLPKFGGRSGIPPHGMGC